MTEQENVAMAEIHEHDRVLKELMITAVGKATTYVDRLNFGVDTTESLAELREVLKKFWAQNNNFPEVFK